jgi:hypothetical protein
MPKVKANEGIINLKVPRDLKYEIKMQALKEQTTMQNLILKIIQDYCKKKDDDLEFEDLDEEDLKDLEEGDKAYAEGRYKTFEQVKEELPCQ